MPKKKRYRVKAWGSDKHPDVEYETDSYPVGISLKYPYSSISLLEPVLRKDIIKALRDSK